MQYKNEILLIHKVKIKQPFEKINEQYVNIGFSAKCYGGNPKNGASYQ